MSVVINTNYSATLASNNLAVSNASLQKSLNRLSSGSKIVSPADDAGGLAVSMKLSAASRRQGAVSQNLGNATSRLQTQDGNLKVTAKILDRISELKTLNSDVTKNASDKANYNSEFKALQLQLTAIGSEKFNGVALFGSTNLSVSATEDGSASSAVTLKGVDLLGNPATAAFAPFSDPFTNLSNWTDSSAITPVSASGGTMTLPDTASRVTTNQSFSGPFELNFDVQSDSIAAIFLVSFGGDNVASLVGPPDTAYHHVRITSDGAGNMAYYYDGATTPDSTNTSAPASGQIEFFANIVAPLHIQNFSMTSTPTASPSNTGNVASAASLGTLSLSTVTSAIQDVATYRAQNGATQSRLGFADELLTTNKANLEAANSRIIDVDVASESTQLARFNTLVQAGTSMLSQANQSAQISLRLLQ